VRVDHSCVPPPLCAVCSCSPPAFDPFELYIKPGLPWWVCEALLLSFRVYPAHLSLSFAGVRLFFTVVNATHAQSLSLGNDSPLDLSGDAADGISNRLVIFLVFLPPKLLRSLPLGFFPPLLRFHRAAFVLEAVKSPVIVHGLRLLFSLAPRLSLRACPSKLVLRLGPSVVSS